MCKKQKAFMIGALILTVGGTALRIIQYVFAIDPVTGYYALKSSSVLALQVLSLVAIILFLASIFSMRDEYLSINRRFNSSLLNLSSIFLLITTAASLYNEITEVIGGKVELITIPYIIIAVFLVIFCLLLIFTDSAKVNGYMYLVPVLYCTIRLIELFIKYTGIANISSRTFDVLILCSLVLFFLYYAKFIINKSGEKRAFAFGLCALFMIAVSVLPALIFMRKPEDTITVQAFLISQAHYLSFALFVFAVFLPTAETKKGYEEYEAAKFKEENPYDIEEEDECYDEDENEDE